MQKMAAIKRVLIVAGLFFFQTEHKMSVEEVCRKYQTDIVQVSPWIVKVVH